MLPGRVEDREKVPQADVLSAMFQKGLGGLAKAVMQGKLGLRVYGEGGCAVAQGEASVNINSVLL